MRRILRSLSKSLAGERRLMTARSRSGGSTALPILALIAGLAAGCASSAPPAARPEPVARTGAAFAAPASDLGGDRLGGSRRAGRSSPIRTRPCPDIEIENDSVSRTYRMQVRSDRQKDFEILICEAKSPPGSAVASIGGTRVPVPPPGAEEDRGDRRHRLPHQMRCRGQVRRPGLQRSRP